MPPQLTRIRKTKSAMLKKVQQYLQDVLKETRKVNWPDRKNLINNSHGAVPAFSGPDRRARHGHHSANPTLGDVRHLFSQS